MKNRNYPSTGTRIKCSDSIGIDWEDNTTTGSSVVGEIPYTQRLPAGLSIFDKLTNVLEKIDDISIRANTISILELINKRLESMSQNLAVTNVLPNLHIDQQDEGSVLLGWNFKDFRAGFIVEKTINKTKWYIISRDRGTDEFIAMERSAGENIDDAVISIIEYVMRNT